MKLRICIALVLLLCGFTALAGGGRAEVRKQAEMSMLVTGTVDIDKDGGVAAHKIDQPDKLPPVVVQLVDQAMSQWRFEPVQVDGRVVKARTTMRLRAVAKQKEDGNYLLRIGSAEFGQEGGVEGETVTSNKLEPPRYPETAVRSNLTGTVYLVLKIDREGTVTDVVDEQVTLSTVGTELQMRKGRKLLADAARSAARKWRFKIPTRGEEADAPYWSVRTPVSFALYSGSRPPKNLEPEYGTWKAYIPGPVTRAPWVEDDQPAGYRPDALADGGVYPVGSGPKLLTPLAQANEG